MGIIKLQGHIIVSQNDLEAVLAEIDNHIWLTQQEEGCITFEITQRSTKNYFDVYEEFVDRTAFELHQQRVANSRWGAITKRVERHDEIRES